MGGNTSCEASPPPPHVLAAADPRIKDRFQTLAASCKQEGTIPGDFLVKLLALAKAEDFGARLCQHVGHDPSQNLDEPTYARIVASALGLATSDKNESRAVFFFHVFSQGREEIDRDGLTSLLTCAEAAAMEIFFPSRQHQPLSETCVRSLVQGVLSGHTTVTASHFENWCSMHCPYVLMGLTRFVELQCTTHVPESETNALETMPLLLCPEGYVSPHLDRPILWLLSSSLPEVYRKSHSWSLLYSSNLHGYGTSQFFQNVLLYKSPTLLLVRDTEGGQVVVCVDSEWHNDFTTFWGGPHCRLFVVLPTFGVYHSPVKVGVDLKTRHVPHGIGIGPTPTKKEAMLWIEDDLATGILRCDPGLPRGTPRDFKVLTIEVWGCGSPEAAASQTLMRARERRSAEQRQQVRNPGDWLENPDRFLLDLAGISVDATSRISTKTR